MNSQNKNKEVNSYQDTTKDKELSNYNKSRFVFTDIYIDLICYIVIICIFLFSYQMFFDSQTMKENLEKEDGKPINYDLPCWVDLAPSLYFLGVIYVLNKIFYFVFNGFVKERLSLGITEEKNLDLADLYIKKSCTSIFKFFFYLSSTILGYYTLRQTEFLPKNFFGKGAFSNIFKEDYPIYLFWKRPENLYIYININLAFSMFDLVECFTHQLQSDFLFMTIHHLSTISLIVYSTLTNNSHVGSTLIFLHFYGDIFSYIVRSILYLDIDDKFKGIATFIFLVNFAYSRIYILIGWLFDIKVGIRHNWFFFEKCLFVFLWILFALHLLWTYMIGKKFVQYLITGKIVDIIKVIKKNNTEEIDKKKK